MPSNIDKAATGYIAANLPPLFIGFLAGLIVGSGITYSVVKLLG